MSERGFVLIRVVPGAVLLVVKKPARLAVIKAVKMPAMVAWKKQARLEPGSQPTAVHGPGLFLHCLIQGCAGQEFVDLLTAQEFVARVVCCWSDLLQVVLRVWGSGSELVLGSWTGWIAVH